MPVLLLASGDPQAKAMLRSAIETRYGYRPPALDTVQLDLKGQVLSKVGPLATWLGIEVHASFKFPTSVRWEYVIRVTGLQVRHSTETFDGRVYSRRNGREGPSTLSDAALLESLQRRLWAVNAAMLTPLGQQNVTLRTLGPQRLEAINDDTGDKAELVLDDEHRLLSVEVRCYNPSAAAEQTFTLTLGEGTVPFDDLILPRTVSASWDDERVLELELIAASMNAPMQEALFSLA